MLNKEGSSAVCVEKGVCVCLLIMMINCDFFLFVFFFVVLVCVFCCCVVVVRLLSVHTIPHTSSQPLEFDVLA